MFHLKSTDMPIGISADRQFTATTFQLAVDDVLVADGITEAENYRGQLWGEEKLESLLRSLQRCHIGANHRIYPRRSVRLREWPASAGRYDTRSDDRSGGLRSLKLWGVRPRFGRWRGGLSGNMKHPASQAGLVLRSRPVGSDVLTWHRLKPTVLEIVVVALASDLTNAVFQFTLTCSHRPIFICLVSVTGSSVAPKYPHLRLNVQQVFSKNTYGAKSVARLARPSPVSFQRTGFSTAMEESGGTPYSR